MTWAQIIVPVRRRLQELSASYFVDEQIKRYGLRCQREMAKKAPALFAFNKRTFSTVIDQSAYPFSTYGGPDVLGLTKVRYDKIDLGVMRGQEEPASSVTSATPSAAYVYDTPEWTLALYPAPPAVKTITLWGFRLPPLEVLTLYHDGGASSTAATYKVSSNTLTLTITGGTNAGTDTFDLTHEDYDTLDELAAAIEALSKGFTATVSGDIPGTEDSSSLENVTATTSIYQRSKDLYENPSVPLVLQDEIVDGILADAFEEENDERRGAKHRKRWQAALDGLESFVRRRELMGQNSRIRDVYQSTWGPFIYPIPGGWIDMRA